VDDVTVTDWRYTVIYDGIVRDVRTEQEAEDVAYEEHTIGNATITVEVEAIDNAGN
jgi:hypothetical protein